MEQLSQPTIEFIRAHSRDDVRLLALQAPRYPDVDMPSAIVQIAGRQNLRFVPVPGDFT